MRSFDRSATSGSRQQPSDDDGDCQTDGGVEYPAHRFDSIVVISNRQPYRHEYDLETGGLTDTVGVSTTTGTDGGSGAACGSNAAIGSHSEGSEGTAPTGSASSQSTRPGGLTIERPTGGLTAGLDPVLQRIGGTWVAWGDGDADHDVVDDRQCVSVPPDDPSYTLQRVWLDEEDLDGYYRGFSNRVLWPLCHGFPLLVEDRPGDFETYRRVNRRFAETALDHAGANSLLWLQDYHFALAPAQIADAASPSTTIGQFWHIPWPTSDVFVRCPHRRELLEGLLGNDLLGFHVDRFASRFLDCADRLLPTASVDRETGVVTHDGGQTRVTATPLGIDADRHARASQEATGAFASVADQIDLPKTTTLGLGVDRLDYTKGIPERVAALERLFERWPKWRGEFTYVQTTSPSRTEIPAYQVLGTRVRRAIERVNDRFATEDWRPIVYTEDHLSRRQLSSLYRQSDLLVVSALCDGMNLVAKEYVAANVDGDGALCLSRRAGAHEQLGKHAFTLDPHRPDQMAETISAAMTASEVDRRRRMSELRRRVFQCDLDWWMSRQFDSLGSRGASGGNATDRHSPQWPR